MPPTQEQRLESLEKKIDAIYASVERARKYALLTAVITVVVIVLPIIGLLFAVPQFMSSYGNIDQQMELLEGL